MLTAAPAHAAHPSARTSAPVGPAQLQPGVSKRSSAALSNHRFQAASFELSSPMTRHDALPSASGVIQLHKKKVKKGKTDPVARARKAKRKRMVGTRKSTVKFDDFHLDDDNLEIEAGQGMAYHAVTHRQFVNEAAYNKYLTESGATIPSGARLGGINKSMLSRRGSVSGMTKVGSKIAEYRMHSYPTSQAIKLKSPRTRMKRYNEALANMSEPAINTAGTPVSTNAVLASSAVIRFDPRAKKHTVSEAYHSQGVSGTGIDHRHGRSSDAAVIYEATRGAAIRRRRKITAAATHHSEGGAIGMMNQARRENGLRDMKGSDNMHAMFTSRPNQVCLNCGTAVAASVNQHSIASSGAGTAFGGQVAGVVAPTSSSGAMSRSTPANELDTDENRRELKYLFGTVA